MKLANAARFGVRAGPPGGVPPGVFWWIAVIGILLGSLRLTSSGGESRNETSEVPRHPGGARRDAGDEFEGGGGLVHGHVSAVERAAADAAGGVEKRGVQRPVD